MGKGNGTSRGNPRPLENSTALSPSFSPVVLVFERVMGPKSRYSPNERLVAIAIARALNRETRSWVIPYSRLANETGISVRTVGTIARLLANGNKARGLLPLFETKPSGPCTGKGRRLRFKLILNQETFAAKRAESRSPRHAVADAVIGAPGSGRVRLSEEQQRLRAELDERKRALGADLLKGKLTDKQFQLAQDRLNKHAANKVYFTPTKTATTARSTATSSTGIRT